MSKHPSSSDTSPDAADSLDWLAFRYVADELSNAERATFETRLEDDQAAREAVASAVELTLAAHQAFLDDAIRVAERQAVTKPAGKRGWYSVALAAGGLLALVVMNNLVWQVGQPASEDRQLAIAWSAARDSFPTSAVTGEESETVAVESGDPEETLVLIEDESVALPTWMLAAVSEANTNMTEEVQGDAIPE